MPRTHLYCDDESVIGSQFYIVDYLEGRVFWNAELPGLETAQRTVLYEEMVAQLAALHQLDFRSLGLADFGKTGNYTARNLARWSKQYAASRLVDIPDMEWLVQKLRQRLPATEDTVLLHGDYGLYNIIVDPVETSILGVLDWEMATLGDPLVDLAHHTRPWWDPPDEAGASATSLIGRDLAQLGIPTLERHVESYCKRRGLASPPDIDFYIGYAQFRYAAMVQGILKRAKDGVASSRKVLHTQQRVVEIAAVARRTLSKRS